MNIEKLRYSITGKILLIGLLVLVLLIPMSMVESVIVERDHVYRSAQGDITRSWGKDITLIDPVLSLEQPDNLSWANGAYVYDSRYRNLSPAKISINGHVQTQIRKRSLFKVPVYSGEITMQGYFILPPEEDDNSANKRNGKIQILLDSRAIRKPPELFWNGEPVEMIAEKAAGQDELVIFYSRLEELDADKNKPWSFLLKLELGGSQALTFLSRAGQSNIDLTSNWPSPGFFGSRLPTTHVINEDGFNAHWDTSNFLADFGHEKSNTIDKGWFNHDRKFGVKFIQTVDTYQLVTRATKYAVLFLTLIFAVYLLFEILGNVILHPMQYLFIGFANCIFYLLLLSLAEHINFNLAYFTSAVSSSLLIALYSMSILKQRNRGSLIFVMLSVLYTFLFVTLKSEDYALLTGSIGLFTILCLIMYFTRNFNWNRVPARQT